MLEVVAVANKSDLAKRDFVIISQYANELGGANRHGASQAKRGNAMDILNSLCAREDLLATATCSFCWACLKDMLAFFLSLFI